MRKFGRNYELQVELENGDRLTITPPLTLELTIVRNTLTSVNACQVRVYNLSAPKRNATRFNISNYGTYRNITLRAGYGSNMAEIFKGNISQAWSERIGPDWITQIECYDGGYAFQNGFTNANVAAGATYKQAITQVIKDLPHVSLGAVGEFNQTLSRPLALSGNPKDILFSLTGGGFFIDNEKAFALKTNEYYSLDGRPTIVINSRSGLLGTPIQEASIVRCRMIFEPQLNIGSAVKLESITGENFNGTYKIISVEHRGVISGAVNGELVTTGGFFFDKLLSPVDA